MRVLCLITIALLLTICKDANAQNSGLIEPQPASASVSDSPSDDELWNWNWWPWVDYACPDPTGRHAALDGQQAIAGEVYPDGTLHGEPLRFAEVRVYSSSGQRVYVGKTSSHGWFTTGPLTSGNYRLEIEGWGSTTVRFRPEVNDGYGGLGVAWGLLLIEDECVVLVPLGGN